MSDYFGIDPNLVDVHMGTFTKSFGASGGYIAGSKTVIDHLRVNCHLGPYAEAMSPPVMTQILASMSSIMGVAPPLALSATSVSSALVTDGSGYRHPDPAPASCVPTWLNLPMHLRDGSEGRMRLRRLAFNARYLSAGLTKLGFIAYGHRDSPVVPLLIFHPGKMCVFSRMMLERQTPIVIVVVAYPATDLVTARARFCLSAAHTKEDVDTLLRACDEIGDLLDIKSLSGERWTVDEVIERAVELVNAPEP